MKRIVKVAFVSTWPEVADGIATFCENLALNLPRELEQYDLEWKVVEVKRFKKIKVKYSNKVVSSIEYDVKSDYKKAAEFLSREDFDIVVVQFINAIYADGGRYIFELLDNLGKPVLVILHSIPMLKEQQNVVEKQKILRKFAKRQIDVVVMSKTAEKFLVDKLGFKSQKVHQIYHGSPVFPAILPHERKIIRKNLGFNEEDKVLFTYGVMREDKGILEIIEALHDLKKSYPKIKLLLCGDEQNNGKPFTKKIDKLINKYKLNSSVKFIRKFIPQADIGKYLQSSEIFITAQKNLGLHSSGTLSYALSVGAVIISTRTQHAEEVLPGRGELVDTNSPKSISEALLRLFKDEKKYQLYRRESRRFGEKILWPNIAKKYLKTIYKVVEEQI